jgi:Tol biopolymer transport system component
MQGKLHWGGAALAWTLALSAIAGCSGSSPTAPPGDSRARLIVYASDVNHLGQYDLYLFDVDGLGNTLSLSINSVVSNDLHPTVTPNGGTVAFESTRGGGAGGSDIYFFDRGQNVFVTVNGINTAADETEPAFSHNATKLVFTQTVGGFKQVRLYNGSTGQLIDLPGLNTASSNNSEPSPDDNATKIAFVSDRNGNADVFVYDAAGDSLLDLPDLASDSTDTDPWITPDGHYLAFASSRPGGAGGLDIYVYDLTTKAFASIATNPNSAATERRPCLSPDGSIITLQSNRPNSLNGSMDIWSCSRTTANTIGNAPSTVGSDVQPFLQYP